MSNVLYAVHGTTEVVSAVAKLKAHWPTAKEINARSQGATQITEAEVAAHENKVAEALALLQEVGNWVKSIDRPQY